MGYQGRDVEVLCEGDLCIVVACDSCGAVGEKKLDVIKASNRVVGTLTTRVALLEVISVGADPKVVTAAISSEPSPTGEALIQGIQAQLYQAGLNHVPLAISTEKNFITEQTGLGISVTGTCLKKNLRVCKTEPGDSLYCLGVPLVGPELSEVTEGQIPTIQDVRTIIEHPAVHDVLPVGSQGIAAELATIAPATGYVTRANAIDLKKSAGSSSCVVVSCRGDHDFTSLVQCPVTKIGNIR